MPKFIPYGRQHIDQQDLAAVAEVLQSDFLTTGPMAEEFEQAYAEYVGAKHAIVVANGTAALHLAMLAADIPAGKRVLTSPNTFVSSANAAAFVGAVPDFVDICPDTYNMSAAELEANWRDDTAAVVAVAFAGQSADLPAIHEICTRKGAVLIEDAAHGVGGGFQHQGQQWKQGGHPWVDLTITSFHPVKTLTTGEGGMVLTNDDVLAAKVRALRSHGTTRDPDTFQGINSGDAQLDERGPWYYEMQALGFNYRITDFQCALGLSQLRRLPAFMQRRREIVARYNEAFSGQSFLRTPKLLRDNDRELISWHLYTAQIDFQGLQTTRSDFMRALREVGVGTQVLYIPVYLQPYYQQQYGYSRGKCPNAEAYYKQALSLPLHMNLSDSDVDHIIASVLDLLRSA